MIVKSSAIKENNPEIKLAKKREYLFITEQKF